MPFRICRARALPQSLPPVGRKHQTADANLFTSFWRHIIHTTHPAHQIFPFLASFLLLLSESGMFRGDQIPTAQLLSKLRCATTPQSKTFLAMRSPLDNRHDQQCGRQSAFPSQSVITKDFLFVCRSGPANCVHLHHCRFPFQTIFFYSKAHVDEALVIMR